MDSSTLNQKEHIIEFQTINEGGEENMEAFNLNQMFKVNFSFDFDLLKTLIEALIKNQQNIQNDLKQRQKKIYDIESQILDLKMLVDSGEVKENKEVQPQTQKPVSTEVNTVNAKLFSISKGGSHEILHAPPNDIQLEVSIGHDDSINKIIVSEKNII